MYAEVNDQQAVIIGVSWVSFSLRCLLAALAYFFMDSLLPLYPHPYK